MNDLICSPLLGIRDTAVALRNTLHGADGPELPAYRPFLEDQITALDEALDLAKIPHHYHVAALGRFKVGKSSFVNKPADEKFAGVESNPETAANLRQPLGPARLLPRVTL